MDLSLIKTVCLKIEYLNKIGVAVIFVVTGPNGSGKTVITKKLLTVLPFHQTFNLGSVAKTIRFVFRDEEVSRLENFTNEKITKLFTPIVQFACSEYQKNGVNVIVEGVQIDTVSPGWQGLITGGIILDVKKDLRLQRNQHPETHFNRAMELGLTDRLEYIESEYFDLINNNQNKDVTFNSTLRTLDRQLDCHLKTIKQINSVSLSEVEVTS